MFDFLFDSLAMMTQTISIPAISALFTQDCLELTLPPRPISNFQPDPIPHHIEDVSPPKLRAGAAGFVLLQTMSAYLL